MFLPSVRTAKPQRLSATTAAARRGRRTGGHVLDSESGRDGHSVRLSPFVAAKSARCACLLLQQAVPFAEEAVQAVAVADRGAAGLADPAGRFRVVHEPARSVDE